MAGPLDWTRERSLGGRKIMRAFRYSLLAVVLVVFGFMAMGCNTVYSPAAGLIWTDVQGPVDAGDKIGAKEGKACAQSILGVVARGDASIKAAAANGGITRIDSVDHHSTWMVVMGEYCTIVRGS
jgi:hypothetical protein